MLQRLKDGQFLDVALVRYAPCRIEALFVAPDGAASTGLWAEFAVFDVGLDGSWQVASVPLDEPATLALSGQL